MCTYALSFTFIANALSLRTHLTCHSRAHERVTAFAHHRFATTILDGHTFFLRLRANNVISGLSCVEAGGETRRRVRYTDTAGEQIVPSC